MISIRSEITRRLLGYYYLNPHESLYVNELSKKLNLDKRNLVKKIRELEDEGILTCEHKGNLKFYSINRVYPLYGEYKKIILKTCGFQESLKKALMGVSGIKGAYIYGSYAKGNIKAHSDIDILVVGDHDIVTLQRGINMIQKTYYREINVVNMDAREYERRKRNKDPFILNILQGKNIKVV